MRLQRKNYNRDCGRKYAKEKAAWKDAQIKADQFSTAITSTSVGFVQEYAENFSHSQYIQHNNHV